VAVTVRSGSNTRASYRGAAMNTSGDGERILVTIPISHFCEKARWALDRAGVDYTEKRHIQILHAFAAKRAGGGRTAPVLRAPEGVYDQSAAIVRYADGFVSEQRRLYPADPAEQADVVAFEQRFDTVLGPEGRRWLYHEVFKDARRFSPWNLTGVPRWERRIFPFVLAPAKVFINRYFAINDATVAAAVQHVDEEFDAVAERLSDGRRYLVADRFSAADLAFAALAAPCITPPDYGTPLPQPDDLTPTMAAAVERWRAHPAGQFALRMFREERPAPKVTSL
jgi:glutathione S-transferase